MVKTSPMTLSKKFGKKKWNGCHSCFYWIQSLLLLFSENLCLVEFIMSHIVMIFSQEKEGRWMWKKPPPASRKGGEGTTIVRKIQRHKQILSAKERLLKGIACLIIFLYRYRHFIRFRPYLASVKELILL